MRTLWLWFFLSCKRYVHRLSFLVILLLLPVVTLGVQGLEQKEGTWIRIVLCVEGEGEGKDRGRYPGRNPQIRSPWNGPWLLTWPRGGRKQVCSASSCVTARTR